MSQKQALQLAVLLMLLAIVWFLVSYRKEQETQATLIEDVNSSITFDGPY